MVHEVGTHGLDRFLRCRFETGYPSAQDDPLTARVLQCTVLLKRLTQLLDLLGQCLLLWLHD
jgi:hypothetical protein